MINVLEISRLYENEWIVLDRALNVLDHGPDLLDLWSKYEGMTSRLTFYFASAFGG